MYCSKMLVPGEVCLGSCCDMKAACHTASNKVRRTVVEVVEEEDSFHLWEEEEEPRLACSEEVVVQVHTPPSYEHAHVNDAVAVGADDVRDDADDDDDELDDIGGAAVAVDRVHVNDRYEEEARRKMIRDSMWVEVLDIHVVLHVPWSHRDPAASGDAVVVGDVVDLAHEACQNETD